MYILSDLAHVSMQFFFLLVFVYFYVLSVKWIFRTSIAQDGHDIAIRTLLRLHINSLQKIPTCIFFHSGGWVFPNTDFRLYCKIPPSTQKCVTVPSAYPYSSPSYGMHRHKCTWLVWKHAILSIICKKNTVRIRASHTFSRSLNRVTILLIKFIQFSNDIESCWSRLLVAASRQFLRSENITEAFLLEGTTLTDYYYENRIKQIALQRSATR